MDHSRCLILALLIVFVVFALARGNYERYYPACTRKEQCMNTCALDCSGPTFDSVPMCERKCRENLTLADQLYGGVDPQMLERYNGYRPPNPPMMYSALGRKGPIKAADTGRTFWKGKSLKEDLEQKWAPGQDTEEHEGDIDLGMAPAVTGYSTVAAFNKLGEMASVQ